MCHGTFLHSVVLVSIEDPSLNQLLQQGWQCGNIPISVISFIIFLFHYFLFFFPSFYGRTMTYGGFQVRGLIELKHQAYATASNARSESRL